MPHSFNSQVWTWTGPGPTPRSGSVEGQGQGQTHCGPDLEGQGQVRQNWSRTWPRPDRGQSTHGSRDCQAEPKPSDRARLRLGFSLGHSFWGAPANFYTKYMLL